MRCAAAARGEGNFKDLQQDRPLDNGKVFSTESHRRCTVRTVTNPEPLLTSSMATILDKTLIAAVLLMIGLLVIAVNLLTIVVVLRTPQLRHSDQWQANMYVLSLAVADLLVGAALVWMACLFIPEARAIIDSSYVLCMSGVFVYTICITVSHVTMLAIALDRLCYIVYPFFYGRLSTENGFLCQDNHTTTEDKVLRPNGRMYKSGKHMSSEESQENGHLEPPIVPTVQDEGNCGGTRQAGPDGPDSEVVLTSHFHVSGVVQSPDVDLSLTTQTDKRTGLATDTNVYTALQRLTLVQSLILAPLKTTVT
ncbi:hypothetical protein C0Q70_10305 [Pomacea canaliculata]|uniref:G-protein coupled receptors family 1 profile domain-containing protein n=1 Tax=Pomacea canaliculata TaxID=400727 RepID=A0A2T7PC86_POMCA|nr:hypothetical protein C0Q70_10305 [Pomacea canaliculata]